ncbi:methylated-DNA--[protein]-cysteine S-methyltransferase [Mucilaginibacter sp. HMF7410]|uniref:Methylated-DNA--protein-cysteine methyltransferase n=2 Tax=Mucilaginibacter arboris TaxID=2682090 RepID=A0A7K1T0W1_9SPHI|nr:methylated-DNA--[protein]-cysteine S-methyltransferase [Mucilaginibacter arboris]
MPIAHYRSPIGVVRIEETEGIISAISVLDEETELVGPQTEVTKLAGQQLHEYFAGKRSMFDFPYQQPGTPFQQQVWQELCKVEFGKTKSYLQLAEQFGNPLAIRAIASANGKNKLWIVVPCHRIIGKNGELTGYAGGLWRKKWLLQHEAIVAGKAQTELF